MLVILRFASNGGFYVANQTLCATLRCILGDIRIVAKTYRYRGKFVRVNFFQVNISSSFLFKKCQNLKLNNIELFDLSVGLAKYQLRILDTNALSFYATKIILVSPKWFWSDQIDLDLTIMIWYWPKWNGRDQNELVRSKWWFSTILNHIWTWPIHFGHDQIIVVKSKSIWSDQIHFGPTKTVLVT